MKVTPETRTNLDIYVHVFYYALSGISYHCMEFILDMGATKLFYYIINMFKHFHWLRPFNL